MFSRKNERRERDEHSDPGRSAAGGRQTLDAPRRASAEHRQEHEYQSGKSGDDGDTVAPEQAEHAKPRNAPTMYTSPWAKFKSSMIP